MSEDGTIVEAIDDLIDARAREYMTAIPGRVEKYDAATQKADVQPLVKRTYTNESGEVVSEIPAVIPEVPVQFMGAGSFRVTFPIPKGSIVLLVFCHSSIAKWLKNGGVVDPGDTRHHDPSDAIAIPGLHFFGAPSDQVSGDAMVLSGDIKLGSKDASDRPALLSELQALKSWLDNHRHYQVGFPSGSPDVGSTFVTSSPHTPIGTIAAGGIPSFSPTPVGASKVEIE